MAKFTLIGGSYRSQSVAAAGQRTVNWYPEIVEKDQSKTKMALYPTPGYKLFAEVPDSLPIYPANTRNAYVTPLRGLITVGSTSGPFWYDGFTKTPVPVPSRTFGVAGEVFFEINSDGTIWPWSVSLQFGGFNAVTLANDNLPVTFAASDQQLIVASAGRLYIFKYGPNNDATGLFADITPYLTGAPSRVAFNDGFFIALIKDTKKFQVSAPLDALTWDPTQIAAVSVVQESLLSSLVSHRQLWLWTNKNCVIYYDSGGSFPFDVAPGGVIEQGCAAADSPARLDNSVFWLGADERGQGIAWRAEGYTPHRISDHGTEFAWQSYSTISDAVGYAYQDQGHAFYVLDFPTAKKTWAYDVATEMWSERGVYNGTDYDGQFSVMHAINFGKHLAGGRNSNLIYDASIAYHDADGAPIRRMRRGPHLCSEQQWLTVPYLQVDVETGLGPQPPLLDGNGNPREPEMILRLSKDGGHTFGQEMGRPCGQAGQFRRRAVWRRLGRARDWQPEISCSDPVSWRVLAAYGEVNQ